jgi:PleD family two-component response regulator
VVPDASVPRIIQRADLALYAATRTGRDRICIWEAYGPKATV